MSDESRVDLLDCPVVRLPTSLAFARSNATSGLDVVGSMSTNADARSRFDKFWLWQIGGGMERVASCGSKLIKTHLECVSDD
jgi:hypothetical protein